MLPKVSKLATKKEEKSNFPVDHYSYSSLALFGSNPIMFKIKHINRQVIDSTNNISSIIGQAFHKAMQTYYGGNDDMPIDDEADAIEKGLKVGMGFLEAYNDGFIKWSSTVPNKQKAQEILAFAFRSYVKEMPYNNGDEVLMTESKLKEKVVVEWKGATINLPVPLKGFPDKVVRKDGKVKIVDYKCVGKKTNLEKIDGKKMLQAVQLYFLVYATTGEEPYSFIFEEVKNVKNQDGSKQVNVYEIVYAENELFFDFYFRYYEDVTRALNGEQVYVPNVETMYDGDVSIIAYIHRLDMEDVVAAKMKKHKVDNVTDLLKKEIAKASSMKKLLQTVEKEFVSAKSLNYHKMANQEKISTKLMEYGILLSFDSVIHGNSVDLYRFNPSIGIKMSAIRSYVDDIEQVMGVSGIRVLAPIPNSTMVGFEVPRPDRTFPALPASSEGFKIAMGQTVMGEERRFDIRTAPHMLVAGSTGSGKSVFLHSLIQQLNKIPNVELHLFDPKQVELNQYEESVAEYKHSPGGIASGLEALVEEMEKRYSKMKVAKVRNISDMTGMPYKFVIVDEYADLSHHEAVGFNVQLLAQKGRACGIHLIIATQRASTKVISGDIKINFSVKAVFRMAKEVDSRVMLDESGAERLLGKGDMLFSTEAGLERLQGFMV